MRRGNKGRKDKCKCEEIIFGDIEKIGVKANSAKWPSGDTYF